MHTSYEDLIKCNPKIGELADANLYEFLSNCNTKTEDALLETWRRHLKENLGLLEKHGLVNDGCKGFGHNKATIAIGAGPSLHRHTKKIMELCQWNARFEIKHQPFIFMCSNHQFKPYLDEGIIPHFVILVDASESDAVYEQLCEKIPLRGHNTVLCCSLYANPKITKKWDKRGGLIQFFAPMGEKIIEEIPEAKGKQIMQGGNVMNASWVIGYGVMGSRIFMALGNDLSYPTSDDVEERRKGYYADGNYSTNLASNRDEAARQFMWMGFEMRNDPFTGKPRIDMKPRSTVQSLYGYKNWLEINIGIQESYAKSFHYYNCSEEGILGVVAKDRTKESLEDKENWILLDEVYPKHYHTTTFEDATSQFITMREIWRQSQIQGLGVNRVTHLPQKTDIARLVDPTRSGVTQSGIII
uniref:6-hydroxymethylpterin diphosphokinase MptE-like domain-containing protein n=1 Tax=viral metagenome TaxID=1070528 RepID=A0A6M3J096_9ZZZZ